MGIVHRDIKPANIFVTRRGHAKIVDFGIAKFFVRPEEVVANSPNIESEEHLTHVGTTVGTTAYMSPEQISAKDLDGRTDIFSFGVVLYQMATGKFPFQGATSGLIMDAILNREPLAPTKLNPDLPLALQEVILRALEKDRNLRYQHAAEMRAELQRLKRDTDSGRRGIDEKEVALTQTAGRSFTTSKRAYDSATQSTAVRHRRISKIIDSLAVLPFQNSSGDPCTQLMRK